jgi:PAS domain S-box-containing protein
MNHELVAHSKLARITSAGHAAAPPVLFAGQEGVLRSVCDALDLLVVLLDGDGQVVLVAGHWPEFETRVTSGSHDAAAHFAQLCGPLIRGGAARDELYAAIPRVLARALDGLIIDVAVQWNGEERWCALHLVPGEGEDGGALVLIEDVTERRAARTALERMQRRYVLATSAGGVGVWDLNLETSEIFLDASLKAQLGYLDREIPDTLEAWSSFVHPEDVGAVEARLREHLDGDAMMYEVEHRMLHRDGGVRWFIARGMLIERRNGRPYRIVGTDVDITERKRIEAAFEAEHLKYRRLFDEAGIALCELDLTPTLPVLEQLRRSGTDIQRYYEDRPEQLDLLQRGAVVRHANARAAALFGGWAGSAGAISLAGLDGDAWLGLLEAVAAGTDHFEREASVLLPTGHRREVVLCATFRIQQSTNLAILSALDVSERKRAEDALRASRVAARRRRREIRQLGSQLMVAQEAERRRIGQELHDDICQRIAALEMLASDGLRRPDAGGGNLREIRQRLAELSRDVRRLSHDMTASQLQGGQLVQALQTYVDELSRLARLNVRVDIRDLPDNIPADAALCVYRIVQEALRNVARHAQTESAAVELHGADDALRLVIADEGCGFDPVAARSAGLGLLSMEERLDRLLGRFDVASVPGRGTRIEAWLPLKQ